jgi:hypothetical protein
VTQEPTATFKLKDYFEGQLMRVPQMSVFAIEVESPWQLINYLEHRYLTLLAYERSYDKLSTGIDRYIFKTGTELGSYNIQFRFGDTQDVVDCTLFVTINREIKGGGCWLRPPSLK